MRVSCLNVFMKIFLSHRNNFSMRHMRKYILYWVELTVVWVVYSIVIQLGDVLCWVVARGKFNNYFQVWARNCIILTIQQCL